MRIAFCSISALDRPLAAAAELARGAGLDAIEVTAHRPHLDPEAGIEAAREAGRAVRAAGVEPITYGSYLGRFGRITAAHAERDAAVASALGAPLLRVWAEPLVEGQTDPAPTVALLRAAADAARADGTTVVIERHIGSFADTPERIDALLDAIDRPNLALNYQVLDALPPHMAAAQPDDAARLVRHARYIHLKNYFPSADGSHLQLGASLERGALDYRAILGAAVRAGYRGPLTIEFLSGEPKPIEEKLAADVAFVRSVLADLGLATTGGASA